MNHQQVWNAVERKLRHEVPDWARGYVAKYAAGTYALACSGEPDALDELAGVVEDCIRVARLSRGEILPTQARKGEPKRLAPRSDADEMIRMQALSEGLALRAAANPEVRRFRREVCGGRLLSADEANELLCSPAAAWFPRAYFERDAVPIVGHKVTAQLLWARGDADVAHVEVEPNHVAWSREVPPQDPEDTEVMDRGVALLPGSVLDELRLLAVEISSWYSWPRDKAVWFVLTGTVPKMLPLQAEIDDVRRGSAYHKLITLKVEPWVPADSVRQFYREAQSLVFGGDAHDDSPHGEGQKAGKALSGGQRPLSAHRLELFQFVVGQIRTLGRRPTWKKLMDEWNWQIARAHESGNDAKGDDSRRHGLPHRYEGKNAWKNFRRDFREIEESVMYPRPRLRLSALRKMFTCANCGRMRKPTKEGQMYCYELDSEGKVKRDCYREMRLKLAESEGDWTKVLQGGPAD